VSSSAVAADGIPGSDRVPWTTSRVSGSPDAPLPFKLERVFAKVKFESPVDLCMAPGSDRVFVVEQQGKVFSFPNDPTAEKPDLLIDLKKDLRNLDKVPQCKGVAAAYAIAFHPDFATNRYCYLCYVLDVPVPGPSAETGSRVSRFTLVQGAGGAPRLDPASEVVLLEWRAGGHNGCCLKFGPDGMLYVSTGDAADPSPPDVLATGQDLDDLMSCVLRIDVNRADAGRPYAIPAGNPFVKTPGARPEIWAYGLRNPWRMSFDRATGDLWIGDVGWELWEMVYRGVAGGNYGWSITEGPQPVRADVKPGPTPIVPPALALPHSESMSITGGFVYRGKRFPDLVGQYVFGDWETRWIWASKVEDGGKLAPYRRLARTDIRIIGFAEDHGGELLVMGYDEGGIYRLVPNDAGSIASSFPRKLSETGLFADVARHTPAPGVVPFEVNAPQWRDGASAERWVAVPGAAPVTRDNNRLVLPKDSVLLRTFFLPAAGGGKERRAVETQLLHYDGLRWNGYTYRWNDQQTDGDLVDAGGTVGAVATTDPAAPGKTREIAWQFHSRSQCITCHNSFADVTLAYTLPQLERVGADGIDQVTRLQRLGMLPAEAGRAGGRRAPMVDPSDASADLGRRARSYLHANCSHCHRFGGGGSALIDLRYDIPLKDTKAIDLRPGLGTFDIEDARVVAPGDPARSVLLYRMAKTGRGRMPHIGSETVDREGLLLVERWVRGMPATASGKDVAPTLDRTAGALAVALGVERGEITGAAKERAVGEAMGSPKEAVRDLFERFAPPGPSNGRLGATVDAGKLLALRGDAARGREVFSGTNAGGAALCAPCHRVGNEGESLGPDLAHVGTKYDRRQLLESILEPSKAIDPQYLTYVLRTKDGKDYSGLLVEKTAARVVLRDAQKREVSVAAQDVARLVPQTLSIMPDGLLTGLTPQQAADLLEFLAAQK
jgi:putative heme-binding domain-containing protein